ncbi:NrfD/PsrC family molybdoenzyme membrane anchor subunit [Alloalcanivorax mobilis]|uniref:NrfD/PsrC family molybdoenzyme membrane anchor subunit n=1 Tax=Alloalcanivorax mobilis TaxID=2019569 RepID=UPI000B5B2D5E|nr:NrfD/PsrC family molybdoenzyme membrane anchor subunit [Alloalcanivorax mobilis]ASK34341.1 hydrogenase [Alcanivorax sp. N3-2A]
MTRDDAPLAPARLDSATLTDRVAAVVLPARAPRAWWLALLLSALLSLLFLTGVVYVLSVGVGAFGLNIPVAWGFPIINTIWWIGIAHAGTLISAVLLLTRQDWRASINRGAEAMAMFAIVLAGSYPLLHLGRPWFAYFLLPYPNIMDLWPQWRSPLVWDFFAIGSYLLFTMSFLYLSLLPDLATLRDRARHRVQQLFYGTLALGWRNSARHWARYEQANRVLAVIAAPIVVSVTGTISMDLSVSIVPGFHFTIFPPYFVAGALYSGFATTAIIAIILRSLFGFRDVITRAHLNRLGIMMLCFVLVVDYAYMCEIFTAFYTGEDFYRSVYFDRWTGPYAPYYWGMILCNVVLAQGLWFRRLRESVPGLLCLALIADIGMWLERFQIVITSTHKDYMPSAWDTVTPTRWDWLIYAGSIGVFFFLLLLFMKLMPAISMHDMRDMLHRRRHRQPKGNPRRERSHE